MLQSWQDTLLGPPSITRDLCPSSLPPLPSTLESLTLSPGDSGISPPPRAELQLPQFLRDAHPLLEVVPSFCVWALPGTSLPSHRTGICVPVTLPRSLASALCRGLHPLVSCVSFILSWIHSLPRHSMFSQSISSAQACNRNEDVQTGCLLSQETHMGVRKHLGTGNT